MNKELDITNGMAECYIAFDSVIPPSDRNLLYIWVKYTFKAFSLLSEEESKAEIEIHQPYELSPITEITADGIYQCAILCQGKIQEIWNALFKEKTSLFRVEILPFEDVEDRINEILASLNDNGSSSIA
jgi:hypothetical protein